MLLKVCSSNGATRIFQFVKTKRVSPQELFAAGNPSKKVVVEVLRSRNAGHRQATRRRTQWGSHNRRAGGLAARRPAQCRVPVGLGQGHLCKLADKHAASSTGVLPSATIAVSPERLLRFCPRDNRGFARLRSEIWFHRSRNSLSAALATLQRCGNALSAVLSIGNRLRSGFTDVAILCLRRLRHFRDVAMSSLQSCRLATA